MRKTLSFVAGLALLAGATTLAHAEPVHQDRAIVAVKRATAAKQQSIVVSGMADGSIQLNGAPIRRDTITAHTPWTGKRFNSQYVCAQNNIGTLWNIDQALAAFESGLNSYVINYRFPAWGDQPCSTSYAASQIIHYGTYNRADGTCYTVDMVSVNGRYTNAVTIGFNVSSSVSGICRPDAQRRNNVASMSSGGALGLAKFSSSTTWTGSVMNSYFDDVYNFAGAHDRTSICQMLGICSG